jgi:hypothetical protein
VDNGYYPSDVQIAVGPQAIVEMTNTTVGVYGRDGGRLASFPMASILGASGDDLSDPQVAWDPTSGRWLASAMDLSTDSTSVSISAGVDPRGQWSQYSYPYGSKLCPDQPRLGFSSVDVVVAVDLFAGSCHSNGDSPSKGGVVVVISKAALLAGLNVAPADQYGPNSAYDNYVPVQMLSASLTDYLPAVDYPNSKVVHVFVLRGAPPSSAIGLKDALLITKLKSPDLASQKGGGTIDAGDDRINDATWQGGTLYLAADDQCTYANDPYLETCARVMEVATGATRDTLLGENDIGFPNGDAYYAALRPDAKGNLIVLFGYSDAHDYPSAGAVAAVGPIHGEHGGSFTTPIKLAGGTAASVQRWGDYQGAAVDPTNPSVVWTAGQVGDQFGSGDNTRWGTHIDALSLGSALVPPLADQVDPGYLYGGRTSQGQRLSLLSAGGGANIASVKVGVRLTCARGTDLVTFTLAREGSQGINALGGFSAGQRYGADRNASGYSATVSGAFTPGQVTGVVSATEQSRTKGACSASGVSFSARD